MKISTVIENIQSRYHVQLDTDFSHNEEDKMANFGEPLVDIGGTFAGDVTRPGQTDTTLSFSPTNGGSGAVATVTLEDGVITEVTIEEGGSGYIDPPDVVVAGDGTGASLTAVLTGDVVTGVTINDGGSGYHQVPVAVAFVLPTQLRRLKSDFPIKQVFDLEDFADADARAKLFASIMTDRAQAARDSVVSRTSPFEGETVVTL